VELFMTVVHVLTALLVLVSLVLGFAKVVAAAPMRVRAAHLGFSTSQYRAIGSLELAAALGLLVGLAAPVIGSLAAAGLLLLLGGAFAVHLRNGDTAKAVAPSVVVAVLAVSYLVALVLAN
jgi:hypothetical protein